MSKHNQNEGKPRPSLVHRDLRGAVNEIIKVREYGVLKYDRMNWAEPMNHPDGGEEFRMDNMDSIHRHLDAMESGETHDVESKLINAAQAACRLMFEIEYILKEEK